MRTRPGSQSPPEPTTVVLASYLLAALAVLLAWPVPVMLSRASWPSRAPAAAMVLWQGIALAGGLSMIGAFLCWGLAPLGDGLIPALGALAHSLLEGSDLPGLNLIHVFALSLAALLFGHLLLTLARTAWRLNRQRQRHREMLRFLSRAGHDEPGTVVIEHATPLAYCLPGASKLTILSSGLVESLDERELRAVLAHEAAHLDQRHDLLLLAFASWHDALPWLPTTRLALEAVGELVEELADDAALRVVERGELLGALAVVATAGGALDAPSTSEAEVPGGTLGATVESNRAARALWEQHTRHQHAAPSESLTSGRLHRLLNPQPAFPAWATRLTMLGGALLVVAPTACLAVTGWSA